jgi:hypothetical protein
MRCVRTTGFGEVLRQVSKQFTYIATTASSIKSDSKSGIMRTGYTEHQRLNHIEGCWRFTHVKK